MTVSTPRLISSLALVAVLAIAPAGRRPRTRRRRLRPSSTSTCTPWTTRARTAVPMCPNTSKFTASDPAGPEAPFGWVQEECTPKLYPSAKGEYMKDVLAEMERLNVTAVVFGSPDSVKKWKDAAPARVIPGTSFEVAGKRVPLEQLRATFTSDGFRVMGEIGLQYQGISPSDMSVDQTEGR